MSLVGVINVKLCVFVGGKGEQVEVGGDIN